MVSTEVLEALAVGVVIVAIVALGFFEYLHRYRLRRLKEMRDGEGAPRLASDRAYNRLALARREADVLAHQGGDVGRARQLIDLADRSLAAHDFDRAFQLAQSAHETLVQARRTPLRSPAPLSNGPGASSPATGATSAASGGSLPPASAAGGPDPAAKNRTEAQFQLHLFQGELASATGSGATEREVGEARTLLVQAQSAFDRADYGEAFRLSLRGRRKVGAHVETVGAPAAGGRTLAAGPASPAGDPAEAAAAVAAQERCPACGHPTVAGDTFCRGCGAARTPTACPKCGADRTPIDTFCGRCGERYATVAT